MNEIHRVKFPFQRKEYDGPKDGEFVEGIKTWVPGTRSEYGDFEWSDEQWVADGEGVMLLEVIGRYKPGQYPERTFYVRRFIDPDGREFGKPKLRMIASSAFNVMAKGYRHTYILNDCE